MCSFPTLYVLVGLTGSGKSTYADQLMAQTDATIICPDDIRSILFGDEPETGSAAELLSRTYGCIVLLLRQGKSVIYDAENVSRADRERLLTAVSSAPCKKIALLFTPDVKTCLRRNHYRNPDGIRRQHAQFVRDGGFIMEEFDEMVVM